MRDATECKTMSVKLRASESRETGNRRAQRVLELARRGPFSEQVARDVAEWAEDFDVDDDAKTRQFIRQRQGIYALAQEQAGTDSTVAESCPRRAPTDPLATTPLLDCDPDILAHLHTMQNATRNDPQDEVREMTNMLRLSGFGEPAHEEDDALPGLSEEVEYEVQESAALPFLREAFA